MRKQTISLLLSLVLLLSLFPPLSALAADRSGNCGDNVTWTLDAETGVLSFEGTGATYAGYALSESDTAHWWQQGDVIREIRIGSGITGIGADLFSARIFASYSEIQRLRNVRTLRVPASVKQIGSDAFCGLTRLDEITILNPNCLIDLGAYGTLGVPGRTVVVGYPDSTAERFAAHNGYEFRAIRCADGAHVFDDTVITPRTCTQDGVAESVCVLCGYKTRRAIPADHDYVITEHLLRTAYTCTRCGDSYVAGECRRLKLDEQVNFKVNAGAYPCFSFTPETTDIYCFYLMQVDARDLYGECESPGSIYDSSGRVVASGASFAVMQAGQTYYYRLSQVYDDALTVSVEVYAWHDYQLTSTTATCTTGGVEIDTCRYCGDLLVQEVPAMGHSYVETVLTEPTCTQPGQIRYTCAFCGRSYTEPLLPDHQYVYDVDLPWYQHAVCSICGEAYTYGTQDPPILEPGRDTAARFDSEGMCCFRFIPETRDIYSIQTSLGGYGSSIAVYTADGKSLGLIGQGRFTVGAELPGGETCYLVLESIRGAGEDFTVRMDLTHQYAAEIIVPASCTAEGQMAYTCTFCGDTYTETIPEDHEWFFDLDLPWYQRGRCTLCGKTGEFGTQTPPVLALGQETQPVYDENGAAFYRFTPDKTDTYGFRFTEDSRDSIVLYDETGLEISRQYDWDYPSCQSFLRGGQTAFLAVYDWDWDGTAPALAAEQIHHYNYVTTEAPTCTEEGRLVGMCIHCGDVVTTSRPPEHDYKYDTWFPWYQHGVCARCGAEIEEGSRTPPEFVLSEPTVAQFDRPGSGVFYSFTPEQDGLYRFRYSGAASSLSVLSADGASIRCYQWTYFESGEVLQEYPLFAGQTYVICLEPESDRTGRVRLTGSQIDDLSPTDVQPGSIVTPSGNGMFAYFRFTAAETGFYEFSGRADSFAWPWADLLDAAGSEMNCEKDFRDDSFHIRFQLEAGQTCILQVDPGTLLREVLLRQVDSLIDFTVLRASRMVIAEPSRDGTTYFSFTPETTGFYEFTSRSGLDAACTLYDSEMGMLDYSNGSPDFRLVNELEAGKTYYYGVSCYNWHMGVQIPVVLRRAVLWSEPYYSWSGDTVFAESYDMDRPYIHVRETVKAECLVLAEPTYTVPGETVYIAAFEKEPFTTQVRVETIPVLQAPPLPCDGEFCPGAQFTDMPAKTHWAHDAVDWALVRGVTTGASDTRFSPDAGCTRAQVATFLWRAAGCPAPTENVNPFSDVDDGAYYHDAVLWALEEGVTTGTTAERFSPDAVCTRAQIVTFLWRFAGSPEPEQAASFDDTVPGAYYEKAVAWAAEQGVTTGTAGGKFSPDSTCTRAQVVTFLYRSLN